MGGRISRLRNRSTSYSFNNKNNKDVKNNKRDKSLSTSAAYTSTAAVASSAAFPTAKEEPIAPEVAPSTESQPPQQVTEEVKSEKPIDVTDAAPVPNGNAQQLPEVTQPTESTPQLEQSKDTESEQSKDTESVQSQEIPAQIQESVAPPSDAPSSDVPVQTEVIIASQATETQSQEPIVPSPQESSLQESVKESVEPEVPTENVPIKEDIKQSEIVSDAAPEVPPVVTQSDVLSQEPQTTQSEQIIELQNEPVLVPQSESSVSESQSVDASSNEIAQEIQETPVIPVETAPNETPKEETPSAEAPAQESTDGQSQPEIVENKQSDAQELTATPLDTQNQPPEEQNNLPSSDTVITGQESVPTKPEEVTASGQTAPEVVSA